MGDRPCPSIVIICDISCDILAVILAVILVVTITMTPERPESPRNQFPKGNESKIVPRSLWCLGGWCLQHEPRPNLSGQSCYGFGAHGIMGQTFLDLRTQWDLSDGHIHLSYGNPSNLPNRIEFQGKYLDIPTSLIPKDPARAGRQSSWWLVHPTADPASLATKK